MAATTRSPASRPRVAVAGQFRLVVEAIGRSLAPCARVLPVPLEACASMNGARDMVLRTRPDLVAIVLAAHDTIDVHHLVAELGARGQRVVVAGQLGPDEAAELRGAGAVAVLEDDGITALVALIARYAAGESLQPAAGATRARRPEPADGRAAERRTRRNLARLTAAEARILWRLMQGSSVTEIARAHVVSVATVRSQIRALLAKLEASSQLSAVALAWQVGWTPSAAVVDAA
ncbi:LuxR C-terminal-related transcriptional regulator [Nocardioides sp. YIM 152315]|uniref:helix-turn-helix transcriptional regulator n=1 Tax=Nocardioides sp. YIM 152315 TaxID=3031760 RepID=UPI0023D9ACB9|nr:LuxR C-terminal-related transcriptional regulator [Nocardioides sp. YIM 152315]MDF1603566.1 LuxR C-terminal-related transcriptional regulator [Nocardioides sp. YIM 152315]